MLKFSTSMLAFLISFAATNQVYAGFPVRCVPEIDGSGAFVAIAFVLGVGTILFKSSDK